MGAFRHILHRILPMMLLAMLVGSMAPQGFMPRFGPDGLTIELCSGTGNKTASIARDDPRYADFLMLQAAAYGQSSSDHDGDDGDNPMPPCAFAGIAMLAVPADSAAIAPILVSRDIPPALHRALLRARHHAATPPATGPPLTS